MTSTSRSTTITGLTNGYSYPVKVRAKNSVGWGLWSDAVAGTPVAVASVPGKPARPSVSAGDGSLTVSWSVPDDGGSAIFGFAVQARSRDGTHHVTQQTGPTTSVTITRLTNGKTYNVSVQAVNSVGSGLWSDAVAGTPVAAASVPGKPARPSVSAGDGSLTVSWSAPDDGGSAITDYDVAYSNDIVFIRWEPDVTSTSRSTTITGLTNGYSYPVKVRAKNSVGWGLWSDAVAGTPVAVASVPGKPARPSVSAGDGSLTVSWSVPDDGGSAIFGFAVQARSRDGTHHVTQQTGPTTSVTITRLTNGKTYNVSVQAVNSVGSGLWSDAVAGTPVAAASVPGKPARPSVSAGDGSLTVSWSAPDDGGSAITDYDVAYSNDIVFIRWEPDVTSTSRSTTITGLTNGYSYPVKVRAKNSVGWGLWSDAVARTPVAVASVPGKPARPSVSAGDGSLTVSWSVPDDGGSAIFGFAVQARSRDGTHHVTQQTGPTTSVTITRLTNGKTYNVSVQAVNSVGSGLWSDAVAGTPVAAASVPGKPARPSVSAGDGSLTVSWSAPDDGGSAITDYDVAYSNDIVFIRWEPDVTSTSRSTTITGLTNGYSYPVKVRAKNSVGWGLWSDAVARTPVAAASVPGKPARPSVSAGDGSLTVSWSAPDDGGSAIFGFAVQARSRDGTHHVTQQTGPTTSVTITRLTNGKTYNVSVQAVNSVGSGLWSDAVAGTPVAAASVPGKPARPSVSAGDGSLTVSWSAPDDEGSTIIGYDVWYLPQGGIGRYWVRGTSATNVTITGLTNGVVYDVHILATNSVGSGPWSDAIAGTPVAAASVPGKPARPSVSAGDGSLTVSWSVPDDGGSTITDYDVRYIDSVYIGCADCGALPWSHWQSGVRSTSLSTTIPGLTNGASYAMAVRAKNSVGWGPWSDDEWGTPVAVASVPGKPARPSVSAGDGSLAVSWSVPDDGGSTIIGYDVWYLPQGGIGRYWVRGTSATNVTITGLTSGVVYDVYVLATNSVGSGPWSDCDSGDAGCGGVCAW